MTVKNNKIQNIINNNSNVSYGEAISLAKSEDEKQYIYKKYILGKPEQIISKLAVDPILRASVLSLISSGFIRTKLNLIEFFGSTFYGYQYKDDWGFSVKLDDAIKLLINYKFIKKVGEKLEPTKIGKRISELYIDPDTAFWIINGLANLENSHPAFSILNLISNTNEMMPLLKLRKGDWEWIDEELVKREDDLLYKSPNEWDIEYDQFKEAFKTSLLLQDWIEEKNEEYILEKYNVRPGELRARISNANWLLYATSELARLLEMKDKISSINKTRFRVQYGIQVELLPLVKLKSIGRYRARRLFTSGIKNIADIKKADEQKIANLIGPGTAKKIKGQLFE